LLHDRGSCVQRWSDFRSPDRCIGGDGIHIQILSPQPSRSDEQGRSKRHRRFAVLVATAGSGSNSCYSHLAGDTISPAKTLAQEESGMIIKKRSTGRSLCLAVSVV